MLAAGLCPTGISGFLSAPADFQAVRLLFKDPHLGVLLPCSLPLSKVRSEHLFLKQNSPQGTSSVSLVLLCSACGLLVWCCLYDMASELRLLVKVFWFVLGSSQMNAC